MGEGLFARLTNDRRALWVAYALGLLATAFGIEETIRTAAYTWVGGIDLRVYESAASLGLTRGWSHIYDQTGQRAYLLPHFPVQAHLGKGYWSPYVTPPPIAWVVAPLHYLPFNVGWEIWTAILTVALIAAALALVRGHPRHWIAALLCLASVGDGLIGLAAGNVVTLLLLAIALSTLLAERQRYWLAGLVLSLVSIKPQCVLLVVPALLVAGYWRTVAAAAAGTVTLAVASAISLGTAGIQDWIHLLHVVGNFKTQRQFTALFLIPNEAVAFLALGLAAVATLYLARAYSGRGPTLPVAIGLAASLLVAPYLNGEDFVLLAAAGVLLVQQELPAVVRCAGAVLIPAAAVANPGAMAQVELAVGTALIALLVFSRSYSVGSTVQPLITNPPWVDAGRPA